jgi:ubiquinone/menaquinone biosynthesis C-methylase UbiE
VSATAFDALAPEYDDAFTHSAIGSVMRAAVWQIIDPLFQPGTALLEMSCGTGEDALHLARRGVRVLATDVSSGMLAQAAAKAQHFGVAGDMRTQRLDLNAADWGLESEGLFDGALSNFGGFNCVADLPAASDKLARALKPGAPLALCVMGPWVPWEWGWYLKEGKPRKAFRRLSGVTEWRGMKIFYPSVRALRRALSKHFKFQSVSAVGAFVPPSYAEPWAQRHPAALARLNGWERRWERGAALVALADHYLAIFTRKDAA